MTFLFYLLAVQGLLVSCGADEEEEVQEAVEKALVCLTNGDCQCAIDELEEIGMQNRNAMYLKTLSSGYACRAGYSTTVVVADDIGGNKLATPSMLGGFTTFTGADEMDSFDEQTFLDLQEAIDILLYAGGISTSVNPDKDRRALFFSDTEASDINAQLFFMLMTQIGKYLYFYGGADADGNKGEDDGDTCLLNYDAAVNYGLFGGSNNCNNDDTGSIRLGVSTDHNTERMCQGVILFNALYDILPALVDSFTGDGFGDLSTIESNLSTAIDDLTAAVPAAADIVNLLSQNVCESTYSDDAAPANDDNLEYYYFFTLESLFE